MTISRRQLLAALPLAAQSRKRPNILWLSFEDSSPMLGCYGDPHAITPHADALAREGVRFTRAYSVAGVCAPSRSGIITGMYPTTLGSMHMRSNVKLADGIRCFPEYLRDAGYYCTNNAKTDYNFPVPTGCWNENGAKAHWRNRAEGQPFFAVFNQEVTHESRYPRRGAVHDADVKRLTPAQRQDPQKLTTLPPFYPDTPETRRDWANVYECLTAMDYWLQDRLKEISDAGLENDTIVFFWGDHGVGLPRSKRWLYESGTRVPLIVRVPARFRAGGQAAPNSVNPSLVSLIDLGPTVLNLCGLPVPANMQGQPFLGAGVKPREYIYGIRDRMDERYDMVRSVRDARYRYLRNYESTRPYYQHMATPESGATMREIRRLQAKGELPLAVARFAGSTKPVEELYDVDADPWEINNLAADPHHRKTLERLRAAHQKWVFETRDLGLIPESELAEEEARLGTRQAIFRDPAWLRDLYAAATGPKPERFQNSPRPALRYWAARRAEPVPEQLLADPSAAVRIAAARRLGQVDILAKELASPAQYARLMAVNALDEMGEAARPALPALRTALKDPENNYVIRVATHAVNALTK
ncbi:MAG: sulfatase-like hydrolase/transferase [Bryobacteraceae bacterium]|nr:sulfatase-like hydrolase/transferase [Bryobacteraceae bacterium]